MVILICHGAPDCHGELVEPCVLRRAQETLNYLFVIYEKVLQVKNAPQTFIVFRKRRDIRASRSFRKTNTHILPTAMPYYGYVPVIYPRFFMRTLTFGNSPLIIPRAQNG